MGTFLDTIPAEVQVQIKDITKTSGLEYNDESIEMMAQAWVEKKNIFEEKISEFGMSETDFLDKDDERGALLMTNSGSLLNIGPMIDGKREVEYTSIGIRKDVPASASNVNSVLASDIEVNQALDFEVGPVSSTSNIFKIAVVDDAESIEDEQETLKSATMIITDEFMDVNKTIIVK
ncbi:MAG: hypothetical protein JW982_09355 [Spirochaetes bacterium]|nr:hypothetical protein [Spirochaetota bacterium]